MNRPESLLDSIDVLVAQRDEWKQKADKLAELLKDFRWATDGYYKEHFDSWYKGLLVEIDKELKKYRKE